MAIHELGDHFQQLFELAVLRHLTAAIGSRLNGVVQRSATQFLHERVDQILGARSARRALSAAQPLALTQRTGILACTGSAAANTAGTTRTTTRTVACAGRRIRATEDFLEQGHQHLSQQLLFAAASGAGILGLPVTVLPVALKRLQ